MAVDSNPEINNGDALPVPSGKAIGSFYRNESVTKCRGAMRRNSRRVLTLTSSILALFTAADWAVAQTPLREIEVNPPKQAPKRPAAPRRVVRRPAPTQTTQTPAPTPPAVSEAAAASKTFSDARERTLPRTGVTATDLDRRAIEALPQGTETPIDKVLLQMPGVHQDSAASGSLHVRNEHANVQYRINGILLPDGVAGMGQVLETGFIGNVALLTGALPAQFGLHTAGVVDITTKSPALDPGGSVSVYGGSRQSFTPSFEYGGAFGKTEYFVTGRGLTNNLGIENPTPGISAIHDLTHQLKFFGYASTMVDETTRFTAISGASVSKFQIPNNPGQTPVFTSPNGPGTTFVPGFIDNFDSSVLNENQIERNYFNVLAVQKSVNNLDLQFSYFNRYSSVHFIPDQPGDLAFNGVASDVYRNSFVNGVQGDAAFRLNDAHTVRAGFSAMGEQTKVTNMSTAFATDDMGNPLDLTMNPLANIVDSTSKFGTTYGLYAQDEWRVTNALTLNFGLRFDQMYQFVDANQFSPRFNAVYKPFEGTTFHAGVARNFTPPSQVIATPVNLPLFNNTTAQPSVSQSDPVLPERSTVYDIGVVQKILPGLEVGLSAYYKQATDLLDDGQFGAAYVLSGFNYEQGVNKGVELKVVYNTGNFRAYGNVALAQQTATNIVSNQFLFGQDELDFIRTHWIFTDHSQTLTASAGMSYLWNGTRFSLDMIYGSGLRSGFANTEHVPAYTQFNAGLSHEFKVPDWKPVTARFDVVNVLDQVYEIRDGSGIGVFAPQFGPRRAYMFGLSQKL
jgi:outer membrane receptor protein involved in Fe transport